MDIADGKQCSSDEQHTSSNPENVALAASSGGELVNETGTGNVSSDNDAYETDIELPEKYQKLIEDQKSKEDAKRRVRSAIVKYSDPDSLGIDAYKKSCARSLMSVLQRKVIEELQKQEFVIRHRHLDSEHIRPICTALKVNLRVEIIDFTGNNIGTKGLFYLNQALKENITITHLNLTDNSIGNGCADTLRYLLFNNVHITHLNLSGNKLTDDTAKLIAKGIGTNKYLIVLNVSNNSFEEIGGQYFAAALAENTVLEELDLSWNKIRRKGATAIGVCLTKNQRLEVLNLSWNGFGYEGILAVSRALRVNKTLKEIDLSSNRVDWKCAMVLAFGLKENTALEVLKIGDNPLTTTGSLDILQAVYSDTSALRNLDITNVNITKDADLLSMAICAYRPFQFKHGNIVPSSDVLGERRDRPLEPMEKVLDHMRKTQLRALELLRSFDKTVSDKISQRDFQRRLEMFQFPMFRFERRNVAESIASEGKGKDTENENYITYSKFIAYAQKQVIKERERKIRERKAQLRQIIRNETIMNPYNWDVQKEVENPQTQCQQGRKPQIRKHVIGVTLPSVKRQNEEEIKKFLHSRPRLGSIL